MAKIFSQQVIRQIKEQSTKQVVYRKAVKEKVSQELLSLRENFLAEFEKHPITQEIEAGPSATNSSGTLSGQGNLFSFIGFPSKAKPIAALRKVLEKHSVRFNHGRGRTTIIIDAPTMDEIIAATPLPWATGRSWVKGIEHGLSGLGRYLNTRRRTGSRSGGGIQVKNKLRGGKFRNTSYLSPLLNKYYKGIEKLKRTSLK
jgi:hypothetical protein